MDTNSLNLKSLKFSSKDISGYHFTGFTEEVTFNIPEKTYTYVYTEVGEYQTGWDSSDYGNYYNEDIVEGFYEVVNGVLSEPTWRVVCTATSGKTTRFNQKSANYKEEQVIVDKLKQLSFESLSYTNFLREGCSRNWSRSEENYLEPANTLIFCDDTRVGYIPEGHDNYIEEELTFNIKEKTFRFVHTHLTKYQTGSDPSITGLYYHDSDIIEGTFKVISGDLSTSFFEVTCVANSGKTRRFDQKLRDYKEDDVITEQFKVLNFYHESDDKKYRESGYGLMRKKGLISGCRLSS